MTLDFETATGLETTTLRADAQTSQKRNWAEELPRSLLEHPLVALIAPALLGSSDLVKLLSKHVSEQIKCDADIAPLIIQELLLQLVRYSSSLRGEETTKVNAKAEGEADKGSRFSKAASSAESGSEIPMSVGDRCAGPVHQLISVIREREQEFLGAAERLLVAFQTLSELGFPSEDRAAQLLLYVRCKGNLGQVIISLMQRPPQANVLVELPSARDAIVCSACHKTIKLDETRFKCGHCASFDLCEACEPTTLHSPTHIFLKIRSTAQLAQGSLPSDFPMLTNRVRHPRKFESHRCLTRRRAPSART